MKWCCGIRAVHRALPAIFSLRQEFLLFMRRSMIHIAYSFILANVICSLLIGCGGPTGPKRTFGDVTGTVKHKGNPVANGSIVFQPPSGAPIVGNIKADGTYTLKGVIGPNDVMINNPRPEPPKAKAGDDFAKNKAAMAEYEKAINEAKIVPDKYTSPKSGLKFEVKAGKNTANFDLD